VFLRPAEVDIVRGVRLWSRDEARSIGLAQFTREQNVLGKAPRGQLVASTEAYPIFRQGVTNASIDRNRHGSDFDGGEIHFVIFEY
jgi:hypothetical protein